MKTYGQIAYEAYYTTCYGLSLISGVRLPKWEEQREDIKAAWEDAAEAVRVEVVATAKDDECPPTTPHLVQ